MTASAFLKINRGYEDEMRAREREANRDKPLLSSGILEFFRDMTGFKPTTYQEELLLDESQFVVARWSRQSGKSLSLTLICLYTALSGPNRKIAILAPSMRQSRLMIRRTTSFLPKLPEYALEGRALKTKLEFTNGSTIEAFPNSPETVRGLTCHLILCLPADTKILLADGTTKRIDKLRVGQLVLSYNTFTNLSEPKRILRVFRNPLGCRAIVRIHHEAGTIDCTSDHRIYTSNRGYVQAKYLASGDRLIVRKEARLETPIRHEVQAGPRTTDTRRPTGRFFSEERQGTTDERIPSGSALVQTSGVRSVQVLSTHGVRPNSPRAIEKSWLGHVEHTLQDPLTPYSHRILSTDISRRQEESYLEVAGQNSFSSGTGYLVHGRRLALQGQHPHCHPCFQPGRTGTDQGLAPQQVEYPSADYSRQAAERILSSFERRGERQTLRSNKTPHDSDDELQSLSVNKVEVENRSTEGEDCSKNHSMRYLPTPLHHSETEPEKLQSGVQHGIQATSSSCLCDSRESEKTTLANATANGQNNTASTMPMLRGSVSTAKWSPEDVFTDMPPDHDPEESKSLRAKEERSKFELVYDLEVEHNHNFFASGVLVSNCDEAGYIENDRDLYDAVVYALGTTNGRLIATSTPGTRDSLFYQMCSDDDLYGDFSRHHVSFHDALEPKGPLKKGILEKLERQMREDPSRWQREMEAEFAEDEEAVFSYGLITSCVDENLEYVEDLNSPGRELKNS